MYHPHTLGIRIPKTAERSHDEFREAARADYHSLKRQAHKGRHIKTRF